MITLLEKVGSKPIPSPYSSQLLNDMAKVQAHYLLLVLHKDGGIFRDLIATQTPWRTMISKNYFWEIFCQQTELLLLGDAESIAENDRVDCFLKYATPLFATGPMASVEEFINYHWFGCFRYGSHPEAHAISIHIRNNIMPHSPFEDMPACFRSLNELCETAASEPFTIKTVICGTWLNDLPLFLSLFPPSYRDSLKVSPPDSKGGFGWWGQLVDKTGRLHEKRAELVLKTGCFPHPRMEGQCSFQDFRRYVSVHLELDIPSTK